MRIFIKQGRRFTSFDGFQPVWPACVCLCLRLVILWIFFTFCLYMMFFFWCLLLVSGVVMKHPVSELKSSSYIMLYNPVENIYFLNEVLIQTPTDVIVQSTTDVTTTLKCISRFISRGGFIRGMWLWGCDSVGWESWKDERGTDA